MGDVPTCEHHDATDHQPGPRASQLSRARIRMLHCIGMYTYKVETAAQTKGTCWNSVWIDPLLDTTASHVHVSVCSNTSLVKFV